MFTTLFGVEWGDCDEAGIVYYPRYFYWMDCAFHRFLRARGLSYREFKRGVVHWKNGRWEARTTGPQGSGILSSMAAGNCLIVLEEERGDVAVGETVLVEPFE